MILHLLDFSLRQRPLILLATLGLIVVGTVAAFRLHIDAVPDITNVQVQINTEVPALAPEEIEKAVTFPLEIEMAGIPGLVELRSLSKFGLSQVNLIFADGTDIYRARQLASERIQNVMEELPLEVRPRLAPITTGLGEIYYFSLDYAPDAPQAPAGRYEQLQELTQIFEWTLKPILRSVPGVAEVNLSGGYDRQVVVQPNPERLLSVGLSFDDLVRVIEENTENAGGGIIRRAGEQITVRVDGRVKTTEEIANLPIRFGARAIPLRIQDVAEVGVGSSLRTGSATRQGDEAVLVGVLMLAGENSRLVSRRIHQRLQELAGQLPAGVEIQTVYNRSDLVNRTIATVRTNLTEGALLVVAVLFALVGNIRAAVIVALAIPLSMLVAMTGMVRLGVSGNLMSLGAIDFGLIVDGAVVMVENILRQMGARQHELKRILNPSERLDVVRGAARQVAAPMSFAVAVITLVYVPILALTGIEGKMFHPMAITVMLALGGSLALALTLVPVLCSFLLRGRVAETDGWVIRAAKRAYAPTLRFALRFKLPVVIFAVALVGAAGIVFQRLGAEFIPQLDEGSFATHMIRTTSIHLDAALEMQKASERILRREFPEITHTASRIGTSEVATDPMGVNVSDTYIFLHPPRTWRQEDGKPVSKDRLASLMAGALEARRPGQALLFSQPIEMRFNEILEGTRADIAVKIFGDEYAELERLAFDVREVLEAIPGAADVEFDALGKAPVLDVQLDRAAMSRLNVHAGEVNRVIATALGGAPAGRLIEGQRHFDIVVRMPDRARDQLESLHRLPLRTDDGALITLGQVARLALEEKVSTMTRESGRRRVAILVNLRGRDVESFVGEARSAIAARIKWPTGYHVEFGGQFKNLQEARQRLAVVVPATLVLIFALVFAAFRSVSQAVVIYTGIPLALTGGVFALWLRGIPFSISAAVGFIALSGIAVLNGVVMISYINQLREAGRRLSDAVMEGALTRLRPVLMTALVASLGFVPMALSTGAGAEVQRPLATVVIGGILSSTLLTLLVLPALYEWMERRRDAAAKA
jgi:cobalt-zinc-cadmium resistance protein CzcA